ncbi:MAG: universal stress protein [Chloroflexi bacterium]|nr:universal stress protein [Chloroflexota bacterium]
MNTLICVGGLPYAETTVKFGALVAGQKQSSLTLLKVVESAGERPSAEKMLREARELIAQPEVEVQVRQGNPAAEIIEESREGEYELIVLGAHVVQSFLDYFMRSVTDAVTKQASVSVLVVKAEKANLNRLLVCTGGQDNSNSVVTFGAELAQAAGANVGLLHVTDPVPAMYAGLETMEETLSALLESNTPLAQHLNWGSELMREYGVSAKLKLCQGIVSEEIVQEADEGGYDLVVVGGRVESNFWNDLLLGTIVPQILHHVPCSVLVVRP